VVGAHYDTVWNSPGADDNASGIAGLLELARIFEGSFPEGLRLVAFCLEEPPTYRTRFMGSYQYAQALKEMGAELTGMICLEMIAYFSDEPKSQSFPLPFMNRIYPSTGNFIALVGNLASRDWTMRVKGAFKSGTDLPVESLNAPFFVVGVDLSDHWSFNQMGYPAVMVTDTAFYRNPHYHRSTDRPETLDFIRGAKVIDGVAAALDALCAG
jgi:Zn-dependent M28 family amino/carboxypeptidase